MQPVVIERTYQFRAPPERIWKAVSDSNLMSEIDGQGTYRAVDVLAADGTVSRRAEGDKFGPFVSQWTEDLGEWVVERHARAFRQVQKGIFETVDFLMNMAPEDDGTRVQFRLELVGRGLLGWLGSISGIAGRRSEQVIRSAVRLIEAELARPAGAASDPADLLAGLPYTAPPIGKAAAERLADLLARLEQVALPDGMARRLADHLTGAPESFLHRIRPLALARSWRAEERETLDLCLAAHHLGLLSLRWEILCPRCRNGKDGVANLSELPDKVHCTTCNIDYDRDFSHNVELVFQPEPWLRPLRAGVTCLMGAASVPHIKVQRHVPPGGELSVDPPLRAGSYRLRTAQAGDQTEIEWDGTGGFPSVCAQGETVTAGPPSPDGTIVLPNATERALTFVIEELAWRRDALTGDRAIANPAFRRYCPDQLLRPGDDVRIAAITLVFTDLKGSTSLYQAIGDSAAYKLVRDHFDYLGEIVAAHRGVLVKTMGDAVMAAFAGPVDALEAALAAQSGIADFNAGRSDGGIILKLGLHQGHCIAVTSGPVLDYFGSTVNLAARLQGESRGGDIVLSAAVMAATGVREWIASRDGLAATEEAAQLRGFAERMQFWRLRVPVRRTPPAKPPPTPDSADH